MIEADKAREKTMKSILRDITDRINQAISQGYYDIRIFTKQSFYLEEYVKSWGYDIEYNEEQERYMISWR